MVSISRFKRRRKAQGYFDFIETGGGFPKETRQLSEALKNPDYLKMLFPSTVAF